MRQNKTQELEHAKKILHDPEFYWNSATSAGIRGSVRRARWIVETADFKPGQRVLEIGCGTGFFSEIFIDAGRGIDLHAIDLSPELLDKAKERCGGRVRLSVSDVESLSHPDGYFDAIVGVRVLHHLDMNAAFDEIIRVLKKSGVIAFCEPNMLNPQIMIQKNIPWIKKIMGDTPGETAFFKWSLKKFLLRHGFRDVRVEPFDFLHPWIPDRAVPWAEKAGLWLERVPAAREIAGSLRIFARKA